MKKSILLGLLLFLLLCSCKKEESSQNQAPFVEIISPLNNAQYSVFDTLELMIEAHDADGTITEVLVYENGLLIISDQDPPFNQSIILKEDGQIDFKVIAKDNSGDKTISKSIEITAYPLQAPTVNFFDQSTSYYTLEGDSLYLKVMAGSENGAIISTYLYIDNELYGEGIGSPSYFVYPNVVIGEYQIYAEAIDEKGVKGSSSTGIINVRANTPPEVSLHKPYNDTYTPGSDIEVGVSVSDLESGIDRVEIYINDEIVDTLYGYPWELTLENLPSGSYELFAKAYDAKGMEGVSEPKFFRILDGFLPNGYISDICASEDENLVFALNKSMSQLMFLDPYTLDYTTIDLPYPKPVSMSYSISDKKLYIAYEFTGSISEYNKVTSLINDISFSSNLDGVQVEVDDLKRRIYLLSNEGLYIINMDSYEIILDNFSIQGEQFALAKNNSFLYATDLGGSPARIYKYSILNDEIQLLQSNNDGGGNPRSISSNPNEEFFVVPCGGGNGYGYTIYAFDSQDINNTLGEFDMEVYPELARFNHDGSLMFATNGDSYLDKLFVFNTTNYLSINSYYLPNSDNCIDIEENINGEKILAFTYNDYGDNHYVIYVINHSMK